MTNIIIKLKYNIDSNTKSHQCFAWQTAYRLINSLIKTRLNICKVVVPLFIINIGNNSSQINDAIVLLVDFFLVDK